jgi:hypothetical protein
MTEIYKKFFFYDNPPIELSQIIKMLTPHMYTTNRLDINCQETVVSTNVLIPVDTVEGTPKIVLNNESLFQQKTLKTERIRPRLIDSLFWCLYIINYGYNDFQQITRNHRVKQLEIQSQLIDKITKDKSCMKNTNIKFTNVAIQELTSDLMSITKAINYNMAMGLCVLYKINVYIIDNSKGVYIKLISSSDVELPTYAIYREKLNTYSVDIEALTADKLSEMEGMICLESYLRPLKTISNYKIDELMEQAMKFELLEDGKKYKKQELYELVYNKIRWE